MRRWLTRKITRTSLKDFIEQHATDERTLDLGGSEGAYALFFPNRVSLDIDETKNPDVVGDAHDLPFEDGEFEVILCTEVLEHLHSPHIAIDEMQRVLKPGGRVILTTRFIYPIHDSPHDYFRFTKYALTHLFREWDLEELHAETHTAGSLAVLFQTLAMKTTLRGGIVTKTLFLFVAKALANMQWLFKEERASGRHGPKRVEDTLMTSGYHIVAKKHT